MRTYGIHCLTAVAIVGLLCGAAGAATISGLTVTGTGLAPEGSAIVVGGFDEDVDAFTDRTHEWNGAGGGEPTIADLKLVGADYIMFANDDRSVSDFNAAVTLDKQAKVYVLMDTRVNGQPKAWMDALGLVDTGFNIGVDEGGGGTGPGNSIENESNIYVAELAPGTYDFGPQNQGGTNMYGIVAQQVPEPATLLLLGAALPGLCAAWRRRRTA